jgi:hypothetical protein
MQGYWQRAEWFLQCGTDTHSYYDEVDDDGGGRLLLAERREGGASAAGYSVAGDSNQTLRDYCLGSEIPLGEKYHNVEIGRNLSI